MTCQLIIPGLVVTDIQYELAVASLTRRAPDLVPTWEQFIQPSRWWLVPGPDGTAYKAEYELEKSPARTARFTLWYGPDLRRDGRPQPHTHPWDFESEVGEGGFDEDRYVLDAAGGVHLSTLTHRAGQVYTLDKRVFHEVKAIHAPGRTTSLMVCGPGERGTWGHLDPDTGRFELNKPGGDPGFQDRLYAINPQHARPSGGSTRVRSAGPLLQRTRPADRSGANRRPGQPGPGGLRRPGA